MKRLSCIIKFDSVKLTVLSFNHKNLYSYEAVSKQLLYFICYLFTCYLFLVKTEELNIPVTHIFCTICKFAKSQYSKNCSNYWIPYFITTTFQPIHSTAFFKCTLKWNEVFFHLQLEYSESMRVACGTRPLHSQLVANRKEWR